MKKRRLAPVSLVVAAAILIAARLHANSPDGRFVAVTGGIQDQVTGLVWEQPDDGNTYTWANAQTHCTGVWRLPTVDELNTLVDLRSASVPLIDTAFTNANAVYWSVTSLAGAGPSSAWYVDFAVGGQGFQSTAAVHRVRCVR